MAYKLTFGDGDAEKSFWEKLSGYTVEITQRGEPETYVVIAMGYDDEFHMPTLHVRCWDEAGNQASEDTKWIVLGGEEEVHVY